MRFVNSYIAPNFNKNLSSDLLNVEEEWHLKLRDDNESRKYGYFNKSNVFLEKEEYIEFIFFLSDEFDQSVECRYLALEIFTLFMERHVVDLYEIIRDSSSPTKKDDWAMVEEKLKEQLILRAVTCVQIASKVVSFNQSLEIIDVSKFLERARCPYTSGAICKSEIRVLKTIDYNLYISTPIVYTEYYIYRIANLIPIEYQAHLYNTSVMGMDILILKKNKILEKYTFMMSDLYAKENEFSPENHRKRILWRDYTFLSITSIIAATYIICNDYTDSVATSLSRICQLEIKNLTNLVYLLVEYVIDKLI